MTNKNENMTNHQKRRRNNAVEQKGYFKRKITWTFKKGNVKGKLKKENLMEIKKGNLKGTFKKDNNMDI